jgi:hypothetical protein
MCETGQRIRKDNAVHETRNCMTLENVRGKTVNNTRQCMRQDSV